MKRFRIAFTSLMHGHARKYLKVLPLMENVEVVAVADERPDVLAQTAEANGIPHTYSDYREMLRKHPGLDLVMAASENVHHLEHVRAIAESGANVMSMKVLSMDLDECDEMIRVCREADVRLFVELELHYNAAVLEAKRLIDEGAVGEVRALTATNMTLRPTAAWHLDPNLVYGREVPLYPGAERLRGGCLTDHPHIFDLARWFSGSDYRTIWAAPGRNAREELVVEENAIVLAEMENGVKVSLDPSFSRTEEANPAGNHIMDKLKWPKAVDVSIEIFGTKGTLLVDTFAPNIYLHAEPYGYLVRYAMYEEWAGLLENVLAALEGRPSVLVSPEDNRSAIEAMQAAYESISTGETILLKGDR
jgi:predicted dehydrogenase